MVSGSEEVTFHPSQWDRVLFLTTPTPFSLPPPLLVFRCPFRVQRERESSVDDWLFKKPRTYLKFLLLHLLPKPATLARGLNLELLTQTKNYLLLKRDLAFLREWLTWYYAGDVNSSLNRAKRFYFRRRAKPRVRIPFKKNEWRVMRMMWIALIRDRSMAAMNRTFAQKMFEANEAYLFPFQRD